MFSTYSLPVFIQNVSNYIEYNTYYKEKHNFINTVPPTASVTADTSYIPHISKRDELYETYYHNFQNLTDYIITSNDLSDYLTEENINNYILIDNYNEIHIYKKQ